MIKYRAHGGGWSEQPLVERLRQRDYRYVVSWTAMDTERAWDGSRWSQGQVETIREHYELVERHGRYRIYAPA